MHVCRRFALLALPMMLGLVALLAGGCASMDRHVFESTQTRPTTVTLVDALEGEPIWHMDIPPDHRLVLQMNRTGEFGATHVSGDPATHMHWSLYQSGQGTATYGPESRRHVDGERIELDGRPVRIDVAYHPPVPRQPALDDEALDDEAMDDEDPLDVEADPSDLETGDQPGDTAEPDVDIEVTPDDEAAPDAGEMEVEPETAPETEGGTDTF